MGKTIKLTFLGDMLCQREQIAAVQKVGCGYDVIFDQVKHLWADSDYVVGNLETPVAGKKMRLAYEAYRFNAPEAFLAAIKKAGVTFLSTANNHSLDRGVKGLNKTLENLDALGFDHDGTFAAKAESERVFIKDFDGFKIAFISCTYGTNQGLKCNYLPDDELWRVRILKHPEQLVTTKMFLVKRFLSNLVPLAVKERLRGRRRAGKPIVSLRDSVPAKEIGRPEHQEFEQRVRELIARAKDSADFVVLLPHVGGQYCSEPGDFQRYTMKWMADAGADLIVANHAHVPQPVVRYSTGVLGFCALGDFCFTPTRDGDKKLSDCSIVLTVTLGVESKKIAGVSYVVTRTERDSSGVARCVPTTEYDVEIKKLLEILV